MKETTWERLTLALLIFITAFVLAHVARYLIWHTPVAEASSVTVSLIIPCTLENMHVSKCVPEELLTMEVTQCIYAPN